MGGLVNLLKKELPPNDPLPNIKDHPSGELWVIGSLTSKRRFKLVPSTQLGSPQVKAGCWKHRYSLFLVYSVVAHEKWNHCQKWMSLFPHLQHTSYQVKYHLNLLHVKTRVFAGIKVKKRVKEFFVFKESHNGQEVRVYHIHSPFSPPPPPPSFSSPGAPCTTQNQLPLQGKLCFLCLHFKHINRKKVGVLIEWTSISPITSFL